ncbi:MAG TPA: hypothetical protein VGK21_02385 [Candidatus Angelobacter sp.]
MDTSATIVLILAVAVVASLALVIYRDRLEWVKIIITRIVSINWRNVPPKDNDRKDLHRKTRSKKVVPDDPKSVSPPAPPPQPSHFRAWFSRRWLKISVSFALIVVLIGTPVWWWNCHPEFWKLELSNHISEAWGLWKQGPKATVNEVQSGRTLQGLTRLLDGYADILDRDPHRVIELWVVDHYWQYWSTDTFNDYVRANRKFVDSGGKIHRMFILTEADLKDPRLTAVFRNQCENIGADVWRGDAALISNKAEYQVTAHAFQQMPSTETGFQSFDVLQLEDLTYYSSNFSPDYRVVGASTWFYGQTLDLKPLFNKSIAQRIDCSSLQTEVVQNSQLQ